ncbi:hypothetical protein [Streptomyces sp. NPDC052107]|uniref:hypothetical protein n=1 Tax=Streptomyces sp. NPDC052107 TaxID=3155632 RepID=UPI00341D22C0
MGHWNPALGPIFYPAWTQPLTTTSGSLTIPASAFHGGAGLYGIGVIQKSATVANNVYAEFTPIRIGTARPAAPLITDPALRAVRQTPKSPSSGSTGATGSTETADS